MEQIQTCHSKLPKRMQVPSLRPTVIRILGDKSWETPPQQSVMGVSEDVTKRSFNYIVMEERAKLMISSLGCLSQINTVLNYHLIRGIDTSRCGHDSKVLSLMANFDLPDGDPTLVGLKASLDTHFENFKARYESLCLDLETKLREALGPLMQEQAREAVVWGESIGCSIKITPAFASQVWDLWNRPTVKAGCNIEPPTCHQRWNGALEPATTVDPGRKRHANLSTQQDATRLVYMAAGRRWSFDNQ